MIGFGCLSIKILVSWNDGYERNKMELLQSQAPIDQELSESSASARHGTSDIGH